MAMSILSLGGSLIVPDEVDYFFLKDLKNFILKRLSQKERFIIVCGGGKTAGRYMQAAQRVSDVTSDSLDWIGIQSSRLNAELVRSIFGKLAYPKVVTDPTSRIGAKHPIIVGAGWKPGWSTDFVAVKFAENSGGKRVINLTNTDYVYDKDPRTYSDAKIIYETTWKDYRKLITGKWSPRLSTPFDPIASKLAQKLKLEVVIMNGKHLTNLGDCLDGKRFDGTTILPKLKKK